MARSRLGESAHHGEIFSVDVFVDNVVHHARATR
jgi:hypothetical protein